MSKGRKTIKVSELLDMHDRFENHANKNLDRVALRIFIEMLLFATDNYEGYSEPDDKARRYFRNDRTRSTN